MYKVILHLFQFQDFFDKVQRVLAVLLVPNHPFPIIEYIILFHIFLRYILLFDTFY